MSKSLAILASSVATVGIAVGAYFVLSPTENQCAPTGVIAGNATIGGPFELVNHKGVTVTDKDVIKDVSLVYFGYTYCPDVCPLDVARNAEAVDLVASDGINVTPVFITIDPARDTPEALSDYVDVTHEKMIALTGTDEQIAAASKAYKTYYRKNGEGEDYLMDHSTFSYLMSPDGFLDYIRRDMTAEQVAEKVGCFVG